MTQIRGCLGWICIIWVDEAAGDLGGSQWIGGRG